ncbi:hypothetical protein SH668x_003386 [Planctomicrobium sp. SH668]|uniref:hypothetical protein n=1 Tax=Planctomicrobium sp. SH668 TaxID=3448126 RepID=UPI003F5C3EFA
MIELITSRSQLKFSMSIVCLMLISVIGIGCRAGLPVWKPKEVAVFDTGASKSQIVAHLNRNVDGTEGVPGLTSWRSSTVKLKVSSIPLSSVPASIAVQAPNNFRLMVSNPLTGGQEADIGSNSERFWIWFKDAPEVMTASHEDVAVALDELQMPIHIHPAWLMEVFGVVPLNEDEFELVRPEVQNGFVDLVASRKSPLGQDVERVIRVNLVQGHVAEHFLRLPGGKILARARMSHYTKQPSGHEIPMMISLDWPDIQQSMVMDIRAPECNCPSLTETSNVWTMPKHAQVVDIGKVARARRGESIDRIESNSIQHASAHEALPPVSGRMRLGDTVPGAMPSKVKLDSAATSATSESSEPTTESDVPEWARQ